MSEQVRPSDEGPHEHGEEPGWSERVTFNAFDDPSGLGMVVRIEAFPGADARLDGTVTLFLPGGEVATVLARDKREPGADGWAAGRIALEAEEPLRRWRLRCKDTALVFAGGGAGGGGSGERRGVVVPVEIDLAFQAWMPAAGGVERRTDVDEQKFVRVVSSGHYEQAGAYAGTVRAGGRTFEIAGSGVRGHSWGSRSDTATHVERWFAVAFSERFAFAVRGVTVGELEMRSGWLLRDGAPRGLSGFRFEADEEGRAITAIRLRLTDTQGETYYVDGQPLARLPLREGATRTTQMMAKFLWAGQETLGLAELGA